MCLLLLAAALPAQTDEANADNPEAAAGAGEADSDPGERPPEGDDLFGDPLFDDPFATGDEENEIDPFADPFATSEPVEGGESAGSESPGGEGSAGDATESAGSLDESLFGMDDFDSLFAEDEIIEESQPEEGEGESATADLLTTEGVRWGGRIRGSVAADFTWDDVWTSDWGPFDPTGQSLTPSIGADLFFDSRPEPEFRAFGKLSIETTDDGQIDLTGFAFDPAAIDDSQLPEGWTSEENEDGDTVIRDENGDTVITIPAADNADETGNEEEPEDEEEEPGDVGTPPGLAIDVFELFADYVWTDRLFFRFGKHTIRWGTGYFFSPADVLNLTAVDAEDPTAEREGPVSLRVQYPFGLTGNLYLYTIVNSGAEPLDVAVAPKVEFAVGDGELAFGGYYQRTLAPRIISLYSASIGDVDVFGEAVVLYGSDRVFVAPSRDQSAAEEDPEDDLDLVLNTYEDPDALYAQFTAGCRYLKEWEDKLSLALIGQYFFNGEGYADDIEGLLPAAARLLANPAENGLQIDDAEQQPDGYEDPPDLTFGDVTNWGRHYAGLTVSLSGILGSNFGVTAFGLVNMSDWSGIVTPAISYSFLDRFAISASARFTVGEEDDEFTDPGALIGGDPAEPTLGLTISLSMPGGSF